MISLSSLFLITVLIEILVSEEINVKVLFSAINLIPFSIGKGVVFEIAFTAVVSESRNSRLLILKIMVAPFIYK